MPKRFEFSENGLHLVFEVDGENRVQLLHLGALPFQEESLPAAARSQCGLIQLQLAGHNRLEHHGLRYLGTLPGEQLTYVRHEDTRNAQGRVLTIRQRDEGTGLAVESVFQFYDGVPVVRLCHTLANPTQAELGIEYVSSLALTGISKEGQRSDEEKLRLHIPHNGWTAELQWSQNTLSQLGFHHASPSGLSSKRIRVTNVGSWSCAEYLPMALLENCESGTCLFWQIEHNGGWHWEISDVQHQLCLVASGPTDIEHQWYKRLGPGETFTTVPVSVGCTAGGFDSAMGALTQYRRRIRRDNRDNRELPVIFNDYMNCLFGDPTPEKLFPLIDAAAKAGCEVFCVDCGWYDDGPWWDGVGEWLPAKGRFPNGIQEITQAIRDKGMVPGLWLEIESMGVKSPKLAQTDDSWFFTRHGKRVLDRSRYQLDFRNPKVRQFAWGVIRRLVEEYGVGYIKMDYNINAGPGTEYQSDSPGDGLLEHNRAYLAWLDEVFAAYPDLVIENCSSGGMRMDYAMLSRHSIQSTSDQTDYRRYACIAAAAPSAVTPEQAAVWSYPLQDGDEEETIFNMVNALLLRIHQSGHLAKLSPRRLELVRQGISLYRQICGDLCQSVPFWPLGMSTFESPWCALGLRAGAKSYVAVWRVHSAEDTCEVPIRHLKGKAVKAQVLYPQGDMDCSTQFYSASGVLSVRLPRDTTARLFLLTQEG